jgi:hydrogenase expression/formation protein HypC
MCLAVPMLLKSVNGSNGEVELGSVRKTINVSLIENPCPGDYLLIHAGFAIEKLDEDEAQERLKLFAQIAELDCQQ